MDDRALIDNDKTLRENDATKCYDCEKLLIDREKELHDTAYREGFNVGVLGLTKQLMGLFSESRAKKYGDSIPVKAVTLFIMTYSSGLLASSHTDDIDKLGSTFISGIGKVIEDFEKTL